MLVLTFRECPTEPKLALRRFVRKMRMFGPLQWGWVMEFQSRGAVHFHVFLERRYFRRFSWHKERVIRRGKATDLVRGGLEELLVSFWMQSVGDKHPDFVAFQHGGICELLRTPDAAARYVAKEAGKRAQKTLPEWLEGAGRWWWLSPAAKPRPVGTVRLEHWPYDRPYKQIFDSAELLRLSAAKISRGSTISYTTATRRPQQTDNDQSEPRNTFQNCDKVMHDNYLPAVGSITCTGAG